MRRIVARGEPACLGEIRNTPGASTWESMPGDCKQSLREAAFAEQHGLCAYCQSRLADAGAPSSTPDGKGMKIEHWAARNARPDLIFDWENLLGVCPGIVVGGPEDEQGQTHCDTFRGQLKAEQQELQHNPKKYPPDAGTLFRYTVAGEMTSDCANADQDILRLNLNVRRLKRNRRGIIDTLRKKLRRSSRINATLLALYRKATSVDGHGRLPPYSQVQAYYLEKKMRSRGLALP